MLSQTQVLKKKKGREAGLDFAIVPDVGEC